MPKFIPYREFPPPDRTEMGKQFNMAKIISDPVVSSRKGGNNKEIEIELNVFFPEGVIFRPRLSNTDYKIIGKTYVSLWISSRWSYVRSIVVRCDDKEVDMVDLISLRKNSYIWRVGKLEPKR